MTKIGSIILAWCFINIAWAAPNANLNSYWAISNDNSVIIIDHQLWQIFLNEYLITTNDITELDYSRVSAEQSDNLKSYIKLLAAMDPRALNLSEQKAYWINLYNALTVKMILENYPVESILDIRPNWFSLGPWNDEIIEVSNQLLSLNDIEHRIIRPVFKDPRIHYALNCASMGCPNLQSKAFTSQNIEELLDFAAIQFINNSKGVNFNGKVLTLSSIYDWYGIDFGLNLIDLFQHLERYTDTEITNRVRSENINVKYDYDWALNERH